jgi:hypothetical protein
MQDPVIIFAVTAASRTLQSGVQDPSAKRPCAMHVVVSFHSSFDQSSHVKISILVRWAKVGKREAFVSATATKESSSANQS